MFKTVNCNIFRWQNRISVTDFLVIGILNSTMRVINSTILRINRAVWRFFSVNSAFFNVNKACVCLNF